MIEISKAIFLLSDFANGFLPATKTMPKEMMPIVDKPLIQYAVEEAAGAGFTDIMFISRRGNRIIEDHFDKAYELEEELVASGKDHVLAELRRQLPVNMRFSSLHLRNEYGQGDALLCAQAFIGPGAFAVMMPDQLIDGEPSAMHQIKDAFLLARRSVIGVQNRDSETPDPFHNVGAALPTQHRVEKIHASGESESASDEFKHVGRYIFTPAVFDCLSHLRASGRERIEMRDVLFAMPAFEDPVQCAIQGSRYDCGKKMGYMKAMTDYGMKHPSIRYELSTYIAALKAKKRMRLAARR